MEGGRSVTSSRIFLVVFTAAVLFAIAAAVYTRDWTKAVLARSLIGARSPSRANSEKKAGSFPSTCAAS